MNSVHGPASATPVELPFGASRRLALLVFTLTLVALVAVWAARLPWFVQIGLSIALIGHGGASIRHMLTPRWQRLRIDGEHFRLEYADGKALSGRLGRSHFVSPLYIGLALRPQGRRWPRSLGVFRHQTDGDSFRRLAVHLRYAIPEETA
ncbi:MAG: hypothetical protein ACOCSR_04585 [Wenzhouxiangella sp.]